MPLRAKGTSLSTTRRFREGRKTLVEGQTVEVDIEPGDRGPLAKRVVFN